MTIVMSQAQGKVPVTILRIDGDLDASNYLDVIARAREAYEAGTRAMLIDMSNMPFMASSGLVALHSIALLLQGEEPPDPEYGWAAFHSLERGPGSSTLTCVKFLNPQPRVERSLKMAGFDRFFEICTDQETAIASF